jgi:hypothetical protein
VARSTFRESFESFGAQEEEGRNLGLLQPPGQCATQLVRVWHSIGSGFHLISLLLQPLAFGGLYILFKVRRLLSSVLVIIVATIIPFWILLWFSSRSTDLWLQDLSTI